MIFFLNLDWPNLQDSAMRIISKYNSIQAQNDMVEDIDAVDLFFFCIHSRLVSVSLLFPSWRVCSISATTRPVSLRDRGLITHLALWPIGFAFIRHLWLAGTLSDAPYRPHTPERNVTVRYRINRISCILENVRSRQESNQTSPSDWTEKSPGKDALGNLTIHWRVYM